MHQRDQFAVGVQKAEVAGAAVTIGQDVLQDQAQECHAAKSAGFNLPSLAVLIAERDVTLVTGQNVFLLYHAPIQITPEVNQSLSASPDRFAIHHPLGGISVRQFQPKKRS